MKTQEERASKTVSLDKNLGGEGVTRRSFMGGAGAMMMGLAAMAAGVSTAHADEAAEAEDAEAEAAEAEEAEATEEAAETAEEEAAATSNYPTIESVTGWTGTPEDVLALGVSTMPLADLNQYRKAYVDAQTDYTCADGTVIPACYVKVRALIHTYGYGAGNTVNDTTFDDIVKNFSEDDCQAFLDMPWGVEFTAYDMYIATGRDVDECTEICDRLSDAGYLRGYDSYQGRKYCQVSNVIGVAEYHLTEYYETDNGTLSEDAIAIWGADVNDDLANGGTPPLYYVPCDESATSDGTILPVDDLKAKARSSSYACIVPCFCRYKALAEAYGHENIPSFEDFATGEYEDYFSDLCDQRVETCLMLGDEAKYWVEQGMGREISGEQAAEYIQRSADDGFMLESTFSKNSEAICSCHADSCFLVQGWLALGDAETIASSNSFKQISHYTLEVDPDLCTACGLCVDRCPLHIISINDEGWAEPDVDCFRCGQCAYVCPQGARKLVQRDESELAEMPQSWLDENNVAAAYRFETGLITFPESSDDAATEETATEEAATEELAE